MSYSFSVSASDKNEAKKKIGDEFAAVLKAQPAHAADMVAAVAAVEGFVDVLAAVPEGHEIYLDMSGSVGWNSDEPDKILGAGVSISASLRKKT